MKNTNQLRRYYDRLTAVERVNLVLDAQERGDEAETYALVDSCPLAECLKTEGRLLALGHVAALLVIQRDFSEPAPCGTLPAWKPEPQRSAVI
jgi:hypothetical protein